MGRFDFRTESARTIPRAAGAAARKDANKPQAAVEQHEQIGTINEKAPRKIHEDGRVEISELDAPNVLGTAFSTKKKWTILSVIFLVQCSMNMNASIYSSGVGHLQDKFGISAQGARAGQLAFLIAYGFGCELWAPWSEELGRWPVLQLSLFFVNLWQIPAALSPTYAGVVVSRILGGLSSAGGSVTLAMVADMWEPTEQQFAIAFIVFSSVFGSVIGPFVGPPIQVYLTWEWICWVQLIFGGFVQILHFVIVPETRSDVLLDREAKRRREQEGQKHIYGPTDFKTDRFSRKEIITTWIRPFHMFVREPIVLCCSLLSGFADSLIFTFLEAFHPIYEQYGFTDLQMAWTFVPIALGYIIAWISYLWPLYKQRQTLRRDPNTPPELRLWWLLFLAPLLAIGLIGFSWSSLGPDKTHWIAPMIFSCLVGIANYAIYMSTIDYMVAAYGGLTNPYAASATGGNGFARDVLAGFAAIYSAPFFTNVGGTSYRYHLQWPTTILAFLAILVTIPIYFFYFNGAWFRERSKFALQLAGERRERDAAKEGDDMDA